MESIKKIKKFKSFSEFGILFKDFNNYSEYYEKCLDYYFKHLEELKGNYFSFFSNYIRNKFHDRITDKLINKYLNGNISFEDIKTYWEEIEELQSGFNENIFNYQIGIDSYGNPIFNEDLINKLKYEKR